MPKAHQLAPRKRPVQKRSGQMLEFILEGAAHVLTKRGLKGFSTNAVAEKAGVSIGSLYQFFPNKDALVAALIIRSQKARAQAVIDAVAAAKGMPLRSSLEIVIRSAIDAQIRNAALERELDKEERRLPVDNIIAETIEAMRSAVSDLLRNTPGKPSITNPDEAARDILVITRALVDAAEDDGSILTDRQALERKLLGAVTGYLNGGTTTNRPSVVR